MVSKPEVVMMPIIVAILLMPQAKPKLALQLALHRGIVQLGQLAPMVSKLEVVMIQIIAM
jgi:hypothetical protein